jgi:hypothetical protein
VTDERPDPSPFGAPGEPPLRNPFRPPPGGTGDLREKGWIPVRWLALWWCLMLLGDVVFYVVLSPIWLGLRGAAWVAEFRARAADRAGRRRRGGT